MNKYKISSGLAAVVLLVSLFACWSTLLLVTVLMDILLNLLIILIHLKFLLIMENKLMCKNKQLILM